MKVLLVTGQLAEHAVYEYASAQNKVEFCVKVLPVSVAALLTPNVVSRELRNDELSDYDLILVPGLMQGDTSAIEKTTRVPVFKGTKHASDVPSLLESLGRIELSKTTAADSILSDSMQRRTKVVLEEAERPEESILERPWNMLIGNEKNKRLCVGRDFPMRVVAEILDAPILTDDEILRKARYYAESGAKIIDIGMRAEEPKPDEVERIVSLLKRRLEIPVSLDTINAEDIDAGLNARVDLILSLNSSNMNMIKNLDKAPDVATVIIPERTEGGGPPPENDSVRRVESLARNIEKARQIGFRKIIADPIMDPLVFPGMVSSVIASKTFSEQYRNVPLMIGVGNVTELLDADSVGANAVVAGIAEELGASLLLTTEGSIKTGGAVSELAQATKMMFLARKRKTPPKDFGVDLLILKEKVIRGIPYDKSIEESNNQLRIFRAEQDKEPPMDPKGFFKINVDRISDEIVVTHYEAGAKSPDVVIRGRDPFSIRDTLMRMGLVSTLQHAYYLGAEIQKACSASQINRSYCQDEELFKQRADM